jgi:hypothetical protein
MKYPLPVRRGGRAGPVAVAVACLLLAACGGSAGAAVGPDVCAIDGGRDTARPRPDAAPDAARPDVRADARPGPDAVVEPEDAAAANPDAWHPPRHDVVTAPDAGGPPPDCGEEPPDAAGPPPDAAGPPPDADRPPPDADGPPSARTVFPHAVGWPAPNAYSWDGSWRPAPGTFPLAGLLDDEYFDGHTTWDGTVTPVLPPGRWDWNDANDDVANWRAFEGSVGRFEPLLDAHDNHFGWRLLGNTPAAVPFAGPAHYFEGTPGVDLLHLGPGGRINSDTRGNLGDGPDVLVFDAAWSLDFRTGSSLTGGRNDNDLVVGGCTANGPGEYDIYGATFHTGPGADRIYVRDVRAAALDAGNGDGGITSVLDPLDGDDVVVLRGNMKDFRVFGGAGDDTVVWYVDELGESIAFAGPNFFGGGGAGDAIWDTAGTDRLVLVIPADTRIVGQGMTQPGELMITHYYGNIPDFSWDAPVYDDLYARYCITCGTGPDGRRTLNLEYRALAGPAFTGWFFVTDFEELQLGVGPDAAVYRIDQARATLTPAPDLAPFRPDPWPEAWCETPPGSGYVPAVQEHGPGPDDDALHWPPADAHWPPPDAPVADPATLYPHAGEPGWPVPNAYAWDGSWVLADYPFPGLFDGEYHDRHVLADGTVTPVLPPGQWDWNDANDDLANWRNFAHSIGTFAPLLDPQRRQFGWRLVPLEPQAVDYAAAAHYVEGTSGTDILDLGPGGLLHSFTVGDLGDGPDVLVFDRAWSLDFRTGNARRGSARDNDLVIAGCSVEPSFAGYDIQAVSIHTGPGSDWIFARDATGAAFDAGNGMGGRTDVLDPADGDDLIVLDGAMADFRVFGGAGDDTVVWYLDRNTAGDISFLGPNFFGGGGSGDAVWDVEGTDRLVLVIPPDTPLVTTTPTPAGALLLRIWSGDHGTIRWDDPVYDDLYARYCVTCGTGPGGRRTLQLEYRSADARVFTGWFWVTDFEELQLGVGEGARVLRLDSAAGRAIPDPTLTPFVPPAVPAGWCR